MGFMKGLSDPRWKMDIFSQRVPCFGDEVVTFPSSIYSKITTIYYNMIDIYIYISLSTLVMDT